MFQASIAIATREHISSRSSYGAIHVGIALFLVGIIGIAVSAYIGGFALDPMTYPMQ